MGDVGSLLGGQAAFNSLGVELMKLLSPGDTRIVYIATGLSPVTYERLRAYNPQGTIASSEGPFNSCRISSALSEGLRQLRADSYREGLGTWFSVRLTVTAEGAATAEYNYDEEPEWDVPVDSVAYVEDSEEFPRDEQHQPDWLKSKLVEGRARLAARDR